MWYKEMTDNFIFLFLFTLPLCIPVEKETDFNCCIVIQKHFLNVGYNF